MKTIIFITGVSTVGKSSLAHILGSKLFMPRNFTIPLTTCREKRIDDDPKYLINLTAEEFQKSQFFINCETYGILNSDIEKFLNSDRKIGICICGPKELSQINIRQKKYYSFNTLKILLRYSDTEVEENKLLTKSINAYFQEDPALKRLSISQELNKLYFFNESYITENIDLILTRTNNIQDWVNIINNRIMHQTLDTIKLNRKSEKYIHYR
ncbi:hypothetical protein [Wolbachia endosymbiont (group A) of Agelastica alni]|uniref:hypothetical protein n=2 Tax=Wolbachia endosymbiont (group A) of Agelastica alni TaxID=3066130 RepID=UPI0031330017